MVNYIGIDPSSKTGFVELDRDGNVINIEEVTSNEKTDLEKFIDVASYLRNSIDNSYKVVIEGFSYGSRGAGVSYQYGLGWIIREHLLMGLIDFVEVSPNTLKKFATGKGNAAKNLVMKDVYKRYGFENDSDNIVDAYVLAQIGRALDGLGEPTKAQMDCIKGLGK
jgi:crossover junction endodeoxyribonuclease RuvC